MGFAIVYIVYSMIVTALDSLLKKMYVDLNHQDYPINYSFARGIGSLSYAIASLALGRLLSSFSERTILYVGMISTLMRPSGEMRGLTVSVMPHA